ERRGELGRILDWYMVKIFPDDRLDHAAELARAAGAIGRRFEARCWWGLAAERSPGGDLPGAGLARLDREARSSGAVPPHLTPAGLLAELDADRGSGRLAHGLRDAGASPRFVDDAEPAGLRFTFDNGVEALHHIPETMSGGLAVLDFDGDGWLDVYAVQ